MSGTELRAAVELLRGADDVTLVAHVHPDADALGSALALGLALHRRGATVRVAAEPVEVPSSLRWLDTAGLLVDPETVPAAPELLVALDTAARDRLGALADRVGTADAVLVVDHHPTNVRFGTHQFVDDTAEATAVLVLDLLDELGMALDEPIARCLYAGLVTDTSSFRRATSGTHAMAGRLLDAGVDPEQTTRVLLDTHGFGWLGMLGAVLGRARLEPGAARGFGMAHAPVHGADSARVGAGETDSVIALLAMTADADVAAVLTEVGPQRWSVSLRSRQYLDVGAAATELGGGGHRRAAGFTADATAETVLAALRATLDRAPLL